MRMPTTLLLMFGVMVGGCGCGRVATKTAMPTKPKATKKTRPVSAAEKQARAMFSGKWRQIVSVKQQSEFGVSGLWTATFDKDKLHMTRRGGQYRFDFAYRLDPGQMPHAINLVLETFVVDDYFKQPKSRYAGIYRFDAMTKKLTLHVSPKKRPRDFERKPDDPSEVLPQRDWLIVLERVQKQ